MKAGITVFFIVLISTNSFAQKTYSDLRKTLPCLDFKDTCSVKVLQDNIAKIHVWLNLHQNDVDAYNDLGLCYYKMCLVDSGSSSFYSGMSLDAFKQYTDLAQAGKKFEGYLDIALIDSFAGRCDDASKNLKLASVLCQDNKLWNTDEENAILKRCKK